MPSLPTHTLRNNRILLVAVALSFLLLLCSAALMLYVARQGSQADLQVVRTIEIKRAISELSNSMTNAESGQRGYLLTHDDAFLEPYRGIRDTFEQKILRLRTLLESRPAQLARVDELVPVLAGRFGVIEQILHFAEQGHGDQAALLMRTRGRPLMDEILARIDDLDAVESRELIQRQRSAATLRNQFIATVMFMLVACAALALFSLISLRRYVNAIEQNRLRLADYNLELEQRVLERTQELARYAQEADRERLRAESLLTDVNHRVGNNLALVSSFLAMQRRAVKNQFAAQALDAARMRVQAVASAHRKLRLGADFATVKANEVLGAVLDDIAAGLPPGGLIRIECQVEPLDINARDAVSLGVLTSELVVNAIKHAFCPGEAGEIQVVLSRPAGGVPYLEVSDNGVGWHEKELHDDGERSGEPNAGDRQDAPSQDVEDQDDAGLGAKIIDMVARQFGGCPQRSPRDDGGGRSGTRIHIELVRLQLMQPV